MKSPSQLRFLCLLVLLPMAASASTELLLCLGESKRVEFSEKVSATGISLRSAAEAESRCKKNLGGESNPGMQRDKDLGDFCASKNPDKTHCTFVSAAGEIEGAPTMGRSRAVQGHDVVDCHAKVKGACTFSCQICAPLCNADGSGGNCLNLIEALPEVRLER